MSRPAAIHGDVDLDGEIVDRRDERLLSAIGADRAAGISVESQLNLVQTLLGSGLAQTLLLRTREVTA